MEIKLTAIQIEKPEPLNFILGQTHFIKSVEDIHEALVTAVPGIKFGLAFCESSGKCLGCCAPCACPPASQRPPDLVVACRQVRSPLRDRPARTVQGDQAR